MIHCSIFGRSIDSVYLKGRSFIEIQQWDSAILYGNRCLELVSRDKNPDIEIKAHFLIAYSLAQKHEFGNSIIEYLKASEIAEFSDSPIHKKLLISLYKNISNITRKYNHYDLTHVYISKSLKLAEEQQDTVQILGLTQNLVNLLIDEKKNSDCVIIIENILDRFPNQPANFKSHFILSLGRLNQDIGKFEEARELYLDVISPKNTSDEHKAVASLNYAWTYSDEGYFKQAIPIFLKTLELCDNIEENNYKFLAHKLLANCYEKDQNLEEALRHYIQAESLILAPKVDPQSYTIYKDISEFYQTNNDEHNALKYNNLYTGELEKHIKEQEEILIQDKKYNMQLLTDRYFDNLKAREIEKQAAINTRNTIVVSIVLLLLLSLGFYYHQRRTKLAIVKALTSIELNSKV